MLKILIFLISSEKVDFFELLYCKIKKKNIIRWRLYRLVIYLYLLKHETCSDSFAINYIEIKFQEDY